MTLKSLKNHKGYEAISPEVFDIIIKGMKNKSDTIREQAYSTWIQLVELVSDEVTEDMNKKLVETLQTYTK